MPAGRFLLFFILRFSGEHEFIWSSDQKIKSAKPSVSASAIYGQEKLKKTAGRFNKKKKKTLCDSLLVAQGFDMSLSTNTVAFL